MHPAMIEQIMRDELPFFESEIFAFERQADFAVAFRTVPQIPDAQIASEAGF